MYAVHAEGESASGLTSAVAVSASTLAEDVRQLAQWCRSADDARDQQDRRLEQLERMPPLQAQLKALQDKACCSARPLSHAVCISYSLKCPFDML